MAAEDEPIGADVSQAWPGDGHHKKVVEMDGSNVVRESTKRDSELQRKNEGLENFTSVVCHDLRNPLAVAQMHLELARQEYDNDHLQTVERAHERMETLIEDVLMLANQREEVMETETIDLADMVKDSWGNVDTSEATLVVDTDRKISAHRSRLHQLLENLMQNAVEHAGEDVKVTVGDLDGGFYVEDDGPGILEDEPERVFEKGYSTADEGTGFGLSIVKRIAESHDWKICVAAGRAGGARFEIFDLEQSC